MMAIQEFSLSSTVVETDYLNAYGLPAKISATPTSIILFTSSGCVLVWFEGTGLPLVVV